MLAVVRTDCFLFRDTHVVEKNELVTPATVEVADGVEHAVPDNCGKKLLNEEGQKTTTDDGKVQVVDLERAVQAESCAAPHELAAAQNEDVVYDKRNGRLLVRRHDRLAGSELELLGRVAEHLLPCGGEDGPEGDAEGTVEGRKTDLEVLEGRHAGGGGVECVDKVVVGFPRECLFVEYRCGGKRRMEDDEGAGVGVACSRVNQMHSLVSCSPNSQQRSDVK